MKKTVMSSMNLHAMLIAVAIATLLGSTVVRADAFDDKARAAATRDEQVAQGKAYAAKLSALTRNNMTMIRRIPRGATITECYNLMAQIWRNEFNGCSLTDVTWNNVPVQVCTEGYDQNLPPEIVSCHYHLATGQDCEIFRNPNMKPRCL